MGFTDEEANLDFNDCRELVQRFLDSFEITGKLSFTSVPPVDGLLI